MKKGKSLSIHLWKMFGLSLCTMIFVVVGSQQISAQQQQAQHLSGVQKPNNQAEIQDFRVDVRDEIRRVQDDSGYSKYEREARLQLLRKAVELVAGGVEIEDSFVVAGSKIKDQIARKLPGVDLKAIVREYTDLFS